MKLPEDLVKALEHDNGYGCRCCADWRGECCCDADWRTDDEVVMDWIAANEAKREPGDISSRIDTLTVLLAYLEVRDA